MSISSRLAANVSMVLLCAALWLWAAGPTHVVMMDTNDLHGHILPENGVGGLAVMAAIVKQHL